MITEAQKPLGVQETSFQVAPPEFISLPEIHLKPFGDLARSGSKSELNSKFIVSQLETAFQAVGSAVVPSGITALLGMMGDQTTQMSRRELLKTLGALAAGGAILSACGPLAPPTPTRPADVKKVAVLLGYKEGYLGLTAADRDRRLMAGNLPIVWQKAEKPEFWEAIKGVVSRDILPELCTGNYLDCDPSLINIEYKNSSSEMRDAIARYDPKNADEMARTKTAIALSGRGESGFWLPRKIVVNSISLQEATKNMDNSTASRFFLETIIEEVIHNQIELDHTFSSADDLRLKQIFTEIMSPQDAKIFQTHDFRYSLGTFPLLVDKSNPNGNFTTIAGLDDLAEAARAYVQRDIIYNGLGLANLQPPTQRSQENEIIAPLFEMVHQEFNISALDFLSAYKKGLLPLVDLYKERARSHGFKAEDKDAMIIILRLSAAMKPVEDSPQGPITPQVKAQVAGEKKQIQDLLVQMKARK